MTNKKIKLTMYGTRDCHLCEEASLLLHGIEMDFDLTYVDIGESEALVEQYGIRIPVLKKADSELGWPFDLDMLKTFIRDAD